MAWVCPRCEQPPPDGATRCPLHDLYAVDARELERRAQAPLLGRVVGDRYALLGFLGAGGMGVVYRAAQLPIRRPVALKILNPEYSRTEDIRRRFEREARAMSRLQSVHTATLYDYGVDPVTGAFMVLELVEGESLRERLDRKGPLAASRVADVIDGVARALHEAHACGIIHRDVKPGNILLARTPEGEPLAKMIDFGIARIDDATRTRTGLAAGTPEYMAPEQCDPNRAGVADARTDVYALATTAYVALCGEPPFTSDRPLSILLAKLRQPPPPLPKGLGLKRLDVPLQRAMARKPDDRPPDAPSFAREFRAALAGQTGRGGGGFLVGVGLGTAVGITLLVALWWGVDAAPEVAPDAQPIADAATHDAPPPAPTPDAHAPDVQVGPDAMHISPEELAATPDPVMHLATTPRSTVIVDGVPMGESSAEAGALEVPLDPATAHTIRIEKAGFRSVEFEVPTAAWTSGVAPSRAMDLERLRAPRKRDLTIGSPRIDGACDRRSVRRSIRRRRSALQGCYLKWSVRSRIRRARATLVWGIDVGGGAINGDVVHTTLGDRAAERCFRGVIQGIRFRKPGSGTCRVRMKISLRRE